MAYQKKSSIAVLFTTMCLLIMSMTTLAFSIVFLINRRNVSYKQIEHNMTENIDHLRDNVLARFAQWRILVQYTSLGVSSLMAQESVDIQSIQTLFKRTVDSQSDVWLLYCTNNLVWNEPGGYVVYHDGGRPAPGWNNTQRAWFKEAKANPGRIIYIEPYRAARNGKLTISIATNVYTDPGQDVGVISADVDIDFLADLLKKDTFMPEQSTYIVNTEGLFISHPDSSAVLTKNFFTDLNLEHYRENILASPSFSNIDKDIFIYSILIPEANWFLISTIPSSIVFSEVNTLMVRLIIIGGIILAFISVLCVIFTRKMLILPIREIECAAEGLANMDFSIQIQNYRHDEIGNMQHALIRIRDSLRGAMDELQEHLTKMTTNSNRLNTVIAESSDALGVINNNMETMQGKVSAQMGAVKATSDSAAEIFRSIDSLNQAVQTQAMHITKSSEAIEQMVLNIGSIRMVVINTGKTTDTLSRSSETGHRMLLKLSEVLKGIEEQSAALQTANKTISDIAGQTNILAMNAAIEAAHAGEAGKGFAVVAGEIRKLAELSGKESESISLEIKKMEQAIEQIGAVSKETVGTMDTIFTGIKAMDASFSTVNHAVDEQATGGSQILTALKTIQDMTLQVQEGTGVISRQSNSIQQELQKLAAISQEVTESVQEARAASENITSFLDNAKELALP
ncbi:MAG: methyl-accepting chemotaxis protein [Treponema sp.]|jgi:methyl-accepting chemotaxis protein|nr:methyl-accepting chemotaxis protein [Treponema sp.]